MQNKIFKRFVLGCLLFGCIYLGVVYTEASSDGWVVNEGKTQYIQDKEIARNKWVVGTSNNIKYLDSSGCLVNGLVTIDKDTYYFDIVSGNEYKGWLGYQDRRYFDETGTLVKGFFSINDNMYYADDNGIIQRGWFNIGSDKYYSRENGAIVKDYFYTIDNSRYYFNKEGKLQTGWLDLEGSKYYLGSTGEVVTGSQTIDGKEYLFSTEDGKMLTGWQGNAYYAETGERVYGWVENTYYLTEEGKLTGFKDIDNKRYYFNENGEVEKAGTFNVDGNTYLVGEDDSVVVNSIVDGNYYNSEGKLTSINEADTNVLSNYGYFSGRQGDVGRFVVPSVGESVACFISYYEFPNNAQAICDASDSAVLMDKWFGYGGQVLADHSNQGFNALKSCSIGDRAYMIHGSTVKTYECEGVDSNGINNGEVALNSQGVNLWNTCYDLVCYTCNQDWEHITIIYWKLV